MSKQQVFERLQANMETFKNQSQEIGYKHLTEMVDAVEERLILCPASTRTNYQGCYPGGLVEHSLRVTSLMFALQAAYDLHNKVDNSSILLTGLFHDIGKLGTLKQDYYFSKDSDWHRKQGILFETNPRLISMPVSLRSLWWLQEHKIQLTEEEHYAISSVKDRSSRPGEDSLPITNEPILGVILQQAVKVACMERKGKTSVFDQ